jgi:hypothetical protein
LSLGYSPQGFTARPGVIQASTTKITQGLRRNWARTTSKDLHFRVIGIPTSKIISYGQIRRLSLPDGAEQGRWGYYGPQYTGPHNDYAADIVQAQSSGTAEVYIDTSPIDSQGVQFSLYLVYTDGTNSDPTPFADGTNRIDVTVANVNTNQRVTNKNLQVTGNAQVDKDFAGSDATSGADGFKDLKLDLNNLSSTGVGPIKSLLLEMPGRQFADGSPARWDIVNNIDSASGQPAWFAELIRSNPGAKNDGPTGSYYVSPRVALPQGQTTIPAGQTLK